MEEHWAPIQKREDVLVKMCVCVATFANVKPVKLMGGDYPGIREIRKIDF